MSKIVILDRDGVINHDSDHYIKSPEEWKPIPGSLEAIARLNQAGYLVVVATNQSGVGRGLFGMDTLNAIHERMVKMLTPLGGRLDGIFFCPHTPDDGCDCRKPKPGLLEAVGRRFNVELGDAVFVGDSLRDLQAAQAVGARSVLVLTGKGEKTRQSPELPEGTPVYADLAAAVGGLLTT